MVLPRPRSYAALAPAEPLAYRQTVSMTAGAEAPLAALKAAPRGATVICHPCDEAIVRHLVAHVGRADVVLHVDETAPAGELGLRVRLAVAS